jgi:4-hydroxybenzoate polyprenyltransferase
MIGNTMNLRWLYIFVLPCYMIDGFFPTFKTTIGTLKHKHLCNTYMLLPENVPNLPPEPPNKIQEWLRLSRLPKNIVSSSLLTLVGAYITHPDTWKLWIISPPFWAAYGMIQCITAYSMIINDIYDIELDRHQHPDRPLILGTITMNEAILSVCGLLSLSFFLGLQFLPPLMDPIWMTDIGLIALYTPFFKKITLVKNMVCATIVASTIPFIAIATMNPIDVVGIYEQHWSSMWITTQMTFMASMYIEMMLDILDQEGDRRANIPTIPVRWGTGTTMELLRFFLLISYISIFTQTVQVGNYHDFWCANSGYLLFYYGWKQVYKDPSRKNILQAIKLTTLALVLFLGLNII